MRRPRRNIEIFSMSVLDMFASALGAFIMVSVILFPYYKKDISQDLEKANVALTKTKDELARTRADTGRQRDQNLKQAAEIVRTRLAPGSQQQCDAGLNQCLLESTRNFLLVQIEWTEPVDVNLHVKDPSGNEFSWLKTNRSGRDYPNTKAKLSIDVATGPGIEVWVDENARSGTYEIEYVIPRPPPRPVTIRGIVFDRSGKKQIPPKTLNADVLRIKAATVKIGGDGLVELR